MTLKIYTSQFRYSGDDRLDITVKSGRKEFAPTWDMVMGHKSDALSDEDYIVMYKQLMNQSYKNNRKVWKELLNRDSVTLVCYCAKGKFCHRVVLAEMMAKAFGCEYVGEVDSKGILIDDHRLCNSCLIDDGIEVELYESETLSRCPRCLSSSPDEITGEEFHKHKEVIVNG